MLSDVQQEQLAGLRFREEQLTKLVARLRGQDQKRFQEELDRTKGEIADLSKKGRRH